MKTTTKATRPAKQTALVIRAIPRNEIDETDGYVALPFDRVEIVKTTVRSSNIGGNVYRCKTATGKRFDAFENDIQIDR